ncbi:MAG: hypothetical protein LC751_06105 [Actinobacteria bacterium]|nr:hypothetical protein [Actinomycetota bacterium]
MDRGRGAALVVLAMVSLISCGSPDADLSGGDVLFLSARGGGLTVIEQGADVPTYSDRNSTPSSNWATIVRSQWQSNTTKLIASDPSTGVHRWETVVGGLQQVKIVSADGTLVATSPRTQRYYLRGRIRTSITVTGSARLEPKRYELEGNFEPEAFSTDRHSLFLVSYLPARHPVNYQVRRLDLITGEVEGVYTPDAHLQQAMGGTARIQAASPDGTRLYTLYTVQGDKNTEPRAFLHVLSLDELWAHCIELPDGFASSDQDTAAVSVSRDGKHVYIADSNSEALVEIDADQLTVSRTGTVDLEVARGTYLADSSEGTLYAASGVDVVAIDLETFQQQDTWQMFSNVTGLQVGTDPNELYVGVDSRIIVLDVTTGARLDEIDPVGVRRIGGLGQVMPPIPQEQEYITCAC